MPQEDQNYITNLQTNTCKYLQYCFHNSVPIVNFMSTWLGYGTKFWGQTLLKFSRQQHWEEDQRLRTSLTAG